MATLLQKAVALYKWGYDPLPLGINKVCRVRQWNSLSRKELLRKCSTDTPKAIGIRLSKNMGVLDLDTPSKKLRDRIIQKLETLLPTTVIRTSTKKNSVAIFFRVEESIPDRKSSIVLLKGENRMEFYTGGTSRYFGISGAKGGGDRYSFVKGKGLTNFAKHLPVLTGEQVRYIFEYYERITHKLKRKGKAERLPYGVSVTIKEDLKLTDLVYLDRGQEPLTVRELYYMALESEYVPLTALGLSDNATGSTNARCRATVLEGTLSLIDFGDKVAHHLRPDELRLIQDEVLMADITEGLAQTKKSKTPTPPEKKTRKKPPEDVINNTPLKEDSQAKKDGEDEELPEARPPRKSVFLDDPGDENYIEQDILKHLITLDDVYLYNGKVATFSYGSLFVENSDTFRSYLTKHFLFLKTTKEGAKPTKLPLPEARSLLSKAQRLPLRELNKVSTAPSVNKEFELINSSGYDVRNKTLYHIHKKDRIKRLKTDELRAKALADLWGYFSEFCFATPEDRGKALMLIFQSLLRQEVPTSPAFVVTAPTYGTGKTFLAECISAIGGYRDSMCTPLPCHNEDEMQKRLHSLLTGGFYIFDNHTGTLKSEALAMHLTAESFTQRRLGSAEATTVSTNKTLVFTGNNLMIARDLKRRSLEIRLDAKTSDTLSRKYKRQDLKQEIVKGRSGIVSTILNLALASKGAEATIANSFTQWSNMFSRIVAYCNKLAVRLGWGVGFFGNPVAEMLQTKEEEEEFLDGVDFLPTLKEHLPAEFDSKDLAAFLSDPSSYIKGITSAILPRKRMGDTVTGRDTGFWLKRHVDEIVSGVRLVRSRRSNINKYAIEEVPT